MSPDERKRALARITGYGERRLCCGSCGQGSDGRAQGWRAFLDRGDDDSECIVILCPACSNELNE